MFWIIVLILAGISIISSFLSLSQLKKKTAIEKHAQKELAKGKILFKKEEASSYSSSSAGSVSSSSDL